MRYNKGDIIHDRYQIESFIDAGGMGAVYLVTDLQSEQLLALKQLEISVESMKGPPEQIEAQQKSIKSNKARFELEYHILSNLDHPNIIKAFEYFSDPHKDEQYIYRAHFVMEYVDGDPLSSLIKASKQPLPVPKAVPLLLQLAQGLHYTHTQGYLHRDLKPANILVTKDQQIKIIDFGIAQDNTTDLSITQDGNTPGTQKYMTPEQFRNEKLDERNDIFNFGLIAFELLTGTSPFQDATTFYVHYIKTLSKDAPDIRALNPDLPRWLSTLVKNCLRKEVKRRYRSMKDIVRSIEKRMPV